MSGRGMTTPQLTFWGILVGLSVLLTLVIYPGVKKNAASRRDSFLASFMASALFSAAVALVVSSIVNAVGTNLGG